VQDRVTGTGDGLHGLYATNMKLEDEGCAPNNFGDGEMSTTMITSCLKYTSQAKTVLMNHFEGDKFTLKIVRQFPIQIFSQKDTTSQS